MMFNFRKDKSISLSLPADGFVHGVRVKKLPMGAYIKAIGTVQNLPEILLKSCFPDMKPAEILDSMKTLDQDTLYAMLGRLVQVIPEHFLRLLADLIDSDYDHLIGLTPKELLEVLRAIWAINDMSDFFGQIKSLWGAMRKTGTNSGSRV